jgi:hypothetical protein
MPIERSALLRQPLPGGLRTWRGADDLISQ